MEACPTCGEDASRVSHRCERCQRRCQTICGQLITERYGGLMRCNAYSAAPAHTSPPDAPASTTEILSDERKRPRPAADQPASDPAIAKRQKAAGHAEREFKQEEDDPPLRGEEQWPNVAEVATAGQDNPSQRGFLLRHREATVMAEEQHHEGSSPSIAELLLAESDEWRGVLDVVLSEGGGGERVANLLLERGGEWRSLAEHLLRMYASAQSAHQLANWGNLSKERAIDVADERLPPPPIPQRRRVFRDADIMHFYNYLVNMGMDEAAAVIVRHKSFSQSVDFFDLLSTTGRTTRVLFSLWFMFKYPAHTGKLPSQTSRESVWFEFHAFLSIIEAVFESAIIVEPRFLLWAIEESFMLDNIYFG